MSYPANKMGLGQFQVDENELSSDIVDIFKPPQIEPDIIGGRTIEIRPVNAVDSNGPYTFLIQSSGMDYVQMPLCRLRGKIKVVKVKEDGSEENCVSSDDYSTVNLLSNSLFKQVLSSIFHLKILFS